MVTTTTAPVWLTDSFNPGPKNKLLIEEILPDLKKCCDIHENYNEPFLPTPEDILRAIETDTPEFNNGHILNFYVHSVLPAVADAWSKRKTRLTTTKRMDELVTASDEALALWMLHVYSNDWIQEFCQTLQDPCSTSLSKMKGRIGKRPSATNIKIFSEYGKRIQAMRKENTEAHERFMAWIKEDCEHLRREDQQKKQAQNDKTESSTNEDGLSDQEDEEDPFMDVYAL